MVRFIATALLAAATALGQSPDTSAIRGQIRDASGAAMARVSLKLTNSETGATRAAQSDDRGLYSFGDLPLTGEYVLETSAAAFETVSRAGLRLRAGEIATIDIILRPEARRSEVTVYGSVEGVRSDSPELGYRLNIADLQELPVMGRKLTNLALLDSAVRPARGVGDMYLGNTLFVVNGGGRRQNSYFVDGASADDAWGRQTIFTSLPLVAIQEVTVLTNSFSAENGRNTAAVMNVNTRAGGNQMHGEALGLWRPAGVQARAPLSLRRTADELEQWSAALSGPVMRDRLHFLAAAEQSFQGRDATITSPLQPGNYRGDYRQTLFLGRIDERLNDRHTVSVRSNFDRFRDTNPSDAVGALNLPGSARIYERRTYSTGLSETAVLRPNLVNAARVSFLVGSPVTNFQPVTPSVQYVVPGVGTTGESRYTSILNHQAQFADTLSLVRGRHTLKIGCDAIRSSNGGDGTEFGSAFVLGQFTFKANLLKPIDQLTLGDATRFQQSFGNMSYHVVDWLTAAFVQDNWRVARGFTVDAGLRYERQSFSDGRLDFSPRLGFAWNPAQDARTVVRGGYGIFMAQLRDNLAANFQINGPDGIFTFSAAPGQLGFPTSLQPLNAMPAGAAVPARDIYVRPGNSAYLSRFFDVSRLRGYPDSLLNPRTQQATLGMERELQHGWVLSADLVHQRTTRIDRPLDLNAPAPFTRTLPGQVRTAAAADATRPVTPVAGGYKRIIAILNDGISKYDALQVNLRKRFTKRFAGSASYTWGHAINTVEPDISSQDPNDQSVRGKVEQASSILDQRHRLVMSGWWQVGGGFTTGAVATLATGRPYNITTGLDNNGDGSSGSDRPVIGNAVVGRNTGEGTPIYDLQTFVQREFAFSEKLHATLRAEAFNLFNHSNIVGRNGVYGNDVSGLPASGFGTA